MRHASPRAAMATQCIDAMRLAADPSILRQVAARLSPRQETNRIARMQPARRVQAMVCVALTAVRAADRAVDVGCGCKRIVPGVSCMDALALVELGGQRRDRSPPVRRAPLRA